MTGPADISAAKAAARTAAFARRKAAHATQTGAAAARHLLTFLQGQPPGPISGYMPIRTEIDPLPVMRELAETRTIGVPVILGPGQPLAFHRWTPDAAMQDGPFGAKIPQDPVPVTPRILILPLVAFDRRGFRLGYGGGFYDRTLAQLRAAGPVLAVGFAYAAQQSENLPTEPTDQPMDAVITENGVTEFVRT